MSEKLDLWNRVSKTDPKHTKKVTFGRGFTAIDPYYQIQCATAEFGPATEGWGWEVIRVEEFREISSIGVLIRLWVKDKNNFIEQWGQGSLYTDNAKGKPDHDLMKKATTDGITKCLSYLGFNADVFTGKFDDNKYVAQMNAEFNKPVGNQDLNMDKVTKAVKWYKEMIDKDAPEETAEVMEERMVRLNDAERQKMRGLLDSKAPGSNKLYRTLLDEHLRYARDLRMGTLPEREYEDIPTGDTN